MADNQRIHPLHDPEAPLVPSAVSKPDQRTPRQAPPPPPPPPPPPLPPPKNRSCFCKCLCWTFSLVLLLVIIIGILIGIIFLVFQPKIPKYSIDKLQITQFNLGTDLVLSATFDVTITAKNPNEKIKIYYEKGSHVSVWYVVTKLCEGSLPEFYQGHRNTTVLNLPLTGRTEDAGSLLTSLQAEQQVAGVIPLDLRVNQPVRLKLGSLKLMKFRFLVRCRLEVDSLSANNLISIKNSKCKYRLRL